MNKFVQVVSNNVEPYCIIFWEKNGVAVSRTICYDSAEALAAVNRYYTEGDFYSTYDDFNIKYTHLNERLFA